MEHSHGQAGLRIVGSGAGPEHEPTSATVVVRSLGAAGYGRHAAPMSAYGPSDLHRLVPVPPVAPRAAERTEVDDDAGQAEVVTESGAGDRSRGEASMKSTGFWARLRLLPRTA